MHVIEYDVEEKSFGNQLARKKDVHTCVDTCVLAVYYIGAVYNTTFFPTKVIL